MPRSHVARILNKGRNKLYDEQLSKLSPGRSDAFAVRPYCRAGVRAERRYLWFHQQLYNARDYDLKLVVALAGMGFVGLIIFGGLTLATNRPRGLAMIGGGLVGALLAGLAFVIVNTLTGTTVSGALLLPAQVWIS